MALVVYVDGPNFINRLIDHGKDKEYIMNVLSFPVLNAIIQGKAALNGLYSHPFIRAYFYYSNMPSIGPFGGEEKDTLIDRLQRDRGVTARHISLSSENGEEKALDSSIIIDMYRMGLLLQNRYQLTFALLASDKDYVPPLQTLGELGIHTITVGYEDAHPIELVNESYLFLDLGELLEEMENEIRK